ncbi:26S proteasome regulatory subunit Rpn12p [Trichomonascus vanleenenianus]|uniref:proteasome regulatory particle lid subunit RPN12 n=1 Tax=Trichomonascus vanleenenianus TaxID=2268995 RepID=UPI003ECBA6EF
MSALESVSKQFISEYEKGSFERAQSLLPKIKLELAKANLIVPNKSAPKNDLLATRQLLEIAVLVAIQNRQEAEISRLIAQVRPFYAPELGIPPSENENKLVALYLLLLVAKNEIAEFHTELETLENPESDPYLSYPIKLERWLMEGSYDKVWRAVTQESEFPSPEFAILAESLVSTVRSEIALCSEHVYQSLPLSNARNLLFLSSDQEVKEFVESQGWHVRNGRIYFPRAEDQESTTVPAESTIANTLDYAREVETII